GIGQSVGTIDHNALVRFAMNLSASTFNTITVSQADVRVLIAATNQELPSGTTINSLFPNDDPVRHRSPTVSLSGSWATMGSIYPTLGSDGEETLSDDFTTVKGRHVLQAGML